MAPKIKYQDVKIYSTPQHYNDWIVELTRETQLTFKWLIACFLIFIALILCSAVIPEIFLTWALLFGVLTICIYVYFQVSIIKTEIAGVNYNVTKLLKQKKIDKDSD
jgi:hypothetical protein